MTIEERAKMYAYSVDKNRGKRWCEARKDYFIAATDQFELDIDKACEWWVAKLNSTEPVDFEKWAEDFRKAMKGE